MHVLAHRPLSSLSRMRAVHGMDGHPPCCPLLLGLRHAARPRLLSTTPWTSRATRHRRGFNTTSPSGVPFIVVCCNAQHPPVLSALQTDSVTDARLTPTARRVERLTKQHGSPHPDSSRIGPAAPVTLHSPSLSSAVDGCTSTASPPSPCRPAMLSVLLLESLPPLPVSVAQGRGVDVDPASRLFIRPVRYLFLHPLRHTSSPRPAQRAERAPAIYSRRGHSATPRCSTSLWFHPTDSGGILADGEAPLLPVRASPRAAQ